MSATERSPSGGRRSRITNATPRPVPSRPSETYERKFSTSPSYKKPEYRDYRMPSWTVAQLGLRIVSLILAGVIAGCSIRSFVSGLILWLPLSGVIFIWEASELIVFAKNRTHGINPMAHIFFELLITLGALVYTALSIYEINIFRGYRSIVEFAVVTGLCAIISAVHSILFIRAFLDLGAKIRLEGDYSV